MVGVKMTILWFLHEGILYCHPLAGLLWGRTVEEVLFEYGREKEPTWECLYVHQKLVLSPASDLTSSLSSSPKFTFFGEGGEGPPEPNFLFPRRRPGVWGLGFRVEGLGFVCNAVPRPLCEGAWGLAAPRDPNKTHSGPPFPFVSGFTFPLQVPLTLRSCCHKPSTHQGNYVRFTLPHSKTHWTCKLTVERRPSIFIMSNWN